MKIVFFQYILQQKENSLLFQFLMAQKMEPKRGDWYSEIVKIMNEFDITLSENEIKVLPASIFKKIVKNKAVSAGIEYLKTKQMKCEKGVRIEYSTLELQDYLKPCSNLQLQEQQYIFSLRSEMNPLKKNFERNTKMKQDLFYKIMSKRI